MLKLTSPQKLMSRAKAGEAFLSTYEQKNVQSIFYRSGRRGTTEKAYLFRPSDGSTQPMTIITMMDGDPSEECKELPMLLDASALAAELEKAVAHWAAPIADPHGISQAVLTALTEVMHAVKKQSTESMP